MNEHDYSKYAYIWNSKRQDYALFTVTCYGKNEYLLYHRPTKTIKLICDSDYGRGLVDKLRAMGVPLLQEPPRVCKVHEVVDAPA